MNLSFDQSQPSHREIMIGVKCSLCTNLVKTGQPKIFIPSSSLDFASVKVNKPKIKKLKITNIGKDPLTLENVSVDGGADFFTNWSGEVTIQPKKSYSLSVAFAPTSTGVKAATLNIISNDPDSPTVPVALVGIGR